MSSAEIDGLGIIVKNHLRPILLAQLEGELTDKAIYRFFRDTGEYGIDICLLSLADVLAIYGPSLPQDVWINQIEVVRRIMDSWWERRESVVAPQKLMSGQDIIDQFGLVEGPLIGILLENLREAQVDGKVNNKKEAHRFIEEKIKQVQSKEKP